MSPAVYPCHMTRLSGRLAAVTVALLLLVAADSADAGDAKALEALHALTARDFREGAKPLPPQIADEQIMMAKATILQAGPSSAEYPDYMLALADLFLDKKAYLDAQVAKVDAELGTANTLRARALKQRRAALLAKSAAAGEAAGATLSTLLDELPKGTHFGPATLSFADFYYGKHQFTEARALYVQAASATPCPSSAYARYMIGLCDLQANKPKAALMRFEEVNETTCTGTGAHPAMVELQKLAKQAAALADKH